MRVLVKHYVRVEVTFLVSVNSEFLANHAAESDARKRLNQRVICNSLQKASGLRQIVIERAAPELFLTKLRAFLDGHRIDAPYIMT